MGREQDIASGKKESGWSNPLGWSDTGNDDDQVVLQTSSKLRFEESGFDTPADSGLGDEMVMNMVQLHDDLPDLNVDVGKLDFSQTDAQIDAAEAAASSVLSPIKPDTIEGDETVV